MNKRNILPFCAFLALIPALVSACGTKTKGSGNLDTVIETRADSIPIHEILQPCFLLERASWNAVGDKAVILRGHSIVTLQCSLVDDGYNYGKGILDGDGYYFTSYEDYVCYTCKEDWNNVLVVCFEVLDEDYVI